MSGKPHKYNSAKEKLDAFKNMSADERKEMAKKVAVEAKDMANKAKDAAKEKLNEFKDMSPEARKEMAKNKVNELKRMPLTNQLKYGAAAAAVLAVLISIFSSDLQASPNTVAEAACKAVKNYDYDSYAELFQPSDKEFMNADSGARELFNLYYKNKAIDCSYLKAKQQGNGKIRFYPAQGDSIFVYLHKDGNWYVGI